MEILGDSSTILAGKVFLAMLVGSCELLSCTITDLEGSFEFIFCIKSSVSSLMKPESMVPGMGLSSCVLLSFGVMILPIYCDY